MRQVAWYVVGNASLGLVIGSFVALSASPVVAVVIPLLFALIAGTGGIYLAREDLTQKTGRDRLRFIGICITSLACFTFLSCGLLLWLARPQLTPNIVDIAGFDKLTSKDVIHLAELRSVSVLLGTSADERKAILQKAAKELQTPVNKTVPPDFEKEKKKLPSILAALADLEEHITKQSAPNLPDNTDGEIVQLRGLLAYATQAILAYQSTNASMDAGSRIAVLIRDIQTSINTILDQPPDVAALDHYPNVLGKLYITKTILELESYSIQEVVVSDSVLLTWHEQHDYPIELLKILAGLPEKSGTALSNTVHTLAARPEDLDRTRGGAS